MEDGIAFVETLLAIYVVYRIETDELLLPVIKAVYDIATLYEMELNGDDATYPLTYLQNCKKENEIS